MDLIGSLSLAGVICFIWLSALAASNLKKVLPSKGETFVEQKEAACKAAKDMNDNLVNKVRGDFDEDELVTQTLGAVPFAKQDSSPAVCGEQPPEQGHGGRTEVDAGSDDGGSNGESETDGVTEGTPGRDGTSPDHAKA